jgi:hypothetical protein
MCKDHLLRDILYALFFELHEGIRSFWIGWAEKIFNWLKYRVSQGSFLYPETMNTFAIRFLCIIQ